MAIPTKEDFEIYLHQMSDFNANELLPEYYGDPQTILGGKTFLIKPIPDDVREMVNKVNQVLNRKYKELENLTVHKWLYQQEAFRRAEKAAAANISLEKRTDLTNKTTENLYVESFLKAYQGMSFDEYIDSLRKYDYKDYSDEELKNKFERINSEKERFVRFEGVIKRYITSQRFEWLHHTVSALSIYYFNDIDTYLENQKEQDKIAKKAKEAIDKYLDVIQTPSSFNLHDRVNEPLFRALTRASLEIEDILEESGFEFKPLQRGGFTARERLLVFNLWKSFQRVLALSGLKRTSNASSITHLLSLEGIDNPIEKRTIEKLIQGWKRQQYKQREMAQETPIEKQILRNEIKKRYRVFPKRKRN